jgi:hypothetical protein
MESETKSQEQELGKEIKVSNSLVLPLTLYSVFPNLNAVQTKKSKDQSY